MRRLLRQAVSLLALALIAALGLFASDVWAQPALGQKPSDLSAGLVAAGIQLNWEAPQERSDEVSGYQILRRRPNEGEARLLILVADTGSAATGYLDASATEPGIEYLYRVKARRGDELSGWTNNVRLTYSAPPPDPDDEPDPDTPSEDRGVARISGPTGVTTRSVAENTAAGVDIGEPVTATDVIGTVGYTLVGSDAGSFNIDAATGQLQTSAALDYEMKSRYELIVRATDSTDSVDIMVTIDVTNVVELQPIIGPATVDYEENRAVRVGTYTASSEADRALVSWSLSGADADSFRIDEPGGVLRFDLPIVSPNLFAPLPDYEASTDSDTNGTYELTVEVGDGVSSESLDVAVTITDQDEAGTLSLSTTRPRQGEIVMATLADADGETGTTTYEWERSAGRSAWNAVIGASASSYTPTAADAGHYLRVTASYTDGHGSGKTAQTVAPNVVLAPTLSQLEVVTTSSRQMYPAFDPEILHYAVGCIAADTLSLTLSTTEADTRLTVDGVQYANQNAVVELTGQGGESDILITLSGGSDGASTTYTLHCLAEDFPTITVTKLDGASEALMTASFEVSSNVAHIAIIDHNGVPRFRRQQSEARHFKAYPDGGYPYALSVTREPASYVVYDANLDVVQSGIATVNLQDTDGHDFFIKPNGDYVLMAYEPSVRDLSFITEQYGLTDSNGDPYGTAEDTEDSVIQVVTPAGHEVFLWNSWDHMALEDCTQHRFPDDYSHINSLQVVDGGDIIASFRGCSKVLRIDGTSGDVIWRLGRSNLSTEEWESRSIGPPPLKIVGDPYGEFCGQHAARLLDNGHLILFDNGVQCVEDPRTGDTVRLGAQFSRVVEYAIDPEHGEAIFQRHAFLHGNMNHLSYAMGQADALDNGNWLTTWGRGLRDPNPQLPPPPDVSATQVNPATGVEELTVVVVSGGNVQTQGRMYPVAPVVLAAEPIALAAELPSSTYTSIFHLGATDSPQVVVSFSRPIIDFDETSPSLSVSGATVADVEPHVVAGEPAHAYLVTLTPDGDGVITFSLIADLPCAAGGICTADGATLSEVPAAPVTIDVTNILELLPLTGPATVEYEENRAVRVATYTASSEADRALLSWSLTGADADSFRIDEPGGVLRFDLPIVSPNLFAPQPDYEAPTDADTGGTYEVTLSASDGTDTVTLDVTVTVTNEDEAGTVTLSPVRPRVGTALNATLTDPDRSTSGVAWAWERSTGPTTWVAIGGADSSSYTPAAADAGYYLRATATYTDGHGSGKSARAVAPYTPLAHLLSALSVTGPARGPYPAFDPEVLHYAMECAAGQTTRLTLSAAESSTRVAVNGVQRSSQNAVVELTGLDGHSDIPITLSGGEGGATTYVLHCFQEDFPDITTVQGPGATEELIGFSLRTNRPRAGLTDSYIMIVDNNGVPRVHRRIGGHAAHFRPQNSETYPFSYPVPDAGTKKVWILVDRDLNELDRVATVSPLLRTDDHDFVILDNGDYLLLSYEPVLRDFSSLTDGDGNPLPVNPDRPDGLYPLLDTAIQIRTPAGAPELTWYSWDHMAVQDCGEGEPFPEGDYAHGNSLWMADGVIVVSVRSCGKVLGIDAATGDVVWRLGRSYRPTEEWGRDELSGQGRGAGPAPMTILNDPYEEFCGQHSAQILVNGHLLLYDNGHPCVVDLATGFSQRTSRVFSRAVEYAIDPDNGEAIFQRHHSLHGDFNRFGVAAGLVQPMGNGDWLISWGWDLLDDDPNAALPPDESVTQVDPDDGTETFSINVQFDHRGEESIPVRAHPLSPVTLAAEPAALAAEIPASSHTSVFHLGATDSPQVVVSFSRPVVDFDETSPSLSVSGATVADVEPHVVAGEPAHAYLVTLTPDDYGPITFRLLSHQACADGGICAAEGTRLTEAPAAPLIIQTFVAEVSIEPGPGPVTEGADATFTLTRNGPVTAELTVNVSVTETGSMLSGALSASATFAVGADTTSLALTTEDDAPIEDPSTVTATIEAGARYQAAAGADTADAVVLDDLPRFLLKVGPVEVSEGGGGAVTVEIDNGVSLATAQTISLALSGTATADDFTLLNTNDRTLSAPYTLTIPANEGVAAAYISTVNDALPEPAETLTITASHDGTEIGTATMTLRASALRLELSSLAASGGGGRAMYPSFDSGTLHYAVGCDPSQTLTLRLTTRDATTRLAVNGVQQVSQNAVVSLDQLDGDDDILISLSNAAGASTTYVVHCMTSNDPLISVVKRPGSAIELIAGSVNEGPGLGVRGHLLVIDANGVPRVHRRIDNPRVTHFRPQDNQEFPYSHALVLPDPFNSPWGARRDFEIAILDRDFNEVRRVTTTSEIPRTDQHDFLIKQNGNFIFMSYAPVAHDISEFVDPDGNPYGTMELIEDSLIEEVTAAGDRVFYWSTYDHLYLGDCMEHQFPADYAHLNSLFLVDGDLVISLRNCSQILRIDGTTGDVQWRLGSSYRSDVEWEALGLQPPLKIIGDPYVEFCGQHSAKLMPNGHLLLYDNGSHCRRDKSTGLPTRPDGEFSRVVEYALDLVRGTATFVRHHSLRHGFSFFSQFQGLVVPMDNDSWLIGWGWSHETFNNPPDTTATEYNPTTNQELLSLTIRRAPSGDIYDSRPYPLGFEALKQPAEPLAAAWPESVHTSVFTFGQSDTPTVVVTFSESVVDFATDTESVSVTGATIASVAAHIVAGEPANAYLFTLTPDSDGPITLRLRADRACASGGICTADGAMLSVVPATYTIKAPVRVWFTRESFTATEGETASVVVGLSEPSGTFGLTIPIVVTGGTASADEYRVPESVVFSSGSDRQTIAIPLGDDALIEGDETIALTFGDLPTGVTPGTNATATVTITDADSASFVFAISDDEVGEGATVELTVTLDGNATFATAQTIELTFPGGTATTGVDFTVTDSRGQTLTVPYALTLDAGASSVVATISIVDDTEQENNETIQVSARHGTASLGDVFITILANDAPPPPTNSPPVFTEGRSAARSLAENTGPSIIIGRRLEATDVDQADTLFYSLGGRDAGSFSINSTNGRLRTKSGIVYDHEAREDYVVTVSVSDGAATVSIDVTIEVTDVDEPPDAPVVQVDSASPISLNVTWMAPATPGRPAVRDYDLRYKLDSESGFSDGPQDVSGTSALIGELIPGSSYNVQVRATNAEGDGPWSASQPGQTAVLPAVTLSLSESSIPANQGMSTVTATVSPASPTPFTVSIWAMAFPPFPGQFETSLDNVLTFAANATESSGEFVITGLVPVVVTVSATVSPTAVLVKPPAPVRLQITESGTTSDPDSSSTSTSNSGAGGGGGGGPPPVGVPSDADFDWNVTRDIESLDGDNELPTDLWSDGETIWVLDNASSGPDSVFAYDLDSGERQAAFEFELDSRNRFSHGLWSDGETVWVADSGQDRLFAYALPGGERLEDRELELVERNRDPRGIWSDGEVIHVLDSVKDALFVYNLETGELLAEHALDKLNRSPRGIWSDGVTLWVSDDGAKRLFAYRIEEGALVRNEDEEFTFRSLLKAGNGDARGIWSDGDVIYVADEQDDRLYSYNLPDAIDARLASLSLSNVEFEDFSPRRLSYTAEAQTGATMTTVAALAAQEAATVVIAPADADGDAENGHQVALGAETQISITVTSSDGSRVKSYRLLVEQPPCLTSLTAERLSEVGFVGGSVDDLGRCARALGVTALFSWSETSWLLYAPDAPAFLSRRFRDHFADGIPAGAALLALAMGQHNTDN